MIERDSASKLFPRHRGRNERKVQATSCYLWKLVWRTERWMVRADHKTQPTVTTPIHTPTIEPTVPSSAPVPPMMAPSAPAKTRKSIISRKIGCAPKIRLRPRHGVEIVCRTPQNVMTQIRPLHVAPISKTVFKNGFKNSRRLVAKGWSRIHRVKGRQRPWL